MPYWVWPACICACCAIITWVCWYIWWSRDDAYAAGCGAGTCPMPACACRYAAWAWACACACACCCCCCCEICCCWCACGCGKLYAGGAMDPAGAGRLRGTEPVKYGCERASAAVMRFAGSNCRSRSSRSRATKSHSTDKTGKKGKEAHLAVMPWGGPARMGFWDTAGTASAGWYSRFADDIEVSTAPRS